MKDEFSTEINGVYDPSRDLPKIGEPVKETQKKEIPKEPEQLKKAIQDNPYFKMENSNEESDWKKRTNQGLFERGSKNRVVNTTFYNFMVVLLVLCVIAGIVFVSWGIYNDKFKTEFFDNSTTVCEGSSFECPSISIPKCELSCPNLNCGNITINPEIFINDVNSS